MTLGWLVSTVALRNVEPLSGSQFFYYKHNFAKDKSK
jgi:hypothetical protein